MKAILSDIKRDFILIAVAGFLLGIALLAFPESSGLILCYICAAVVALFGIMHLVSYFVRRAPEHIFRYDMAQGLIGLALGIYLFLFPEALLGILPIVLGIGVIVDSVVKLQNSFDLARMGVSFWWISLLLSLCTGTLGILMLTNPFATAQVLLMFIGISLITNSLVDFWNIFFLSSRIKQVKKVIEDAVTKANAVDSQGHFVD